MRELETGTLVGTGAAINVELGWVPQYVKVFNTTDGTRVDEWIIGMADGTAISTVAAAGPVKTATNGISKFLGNDTIGKGFTIGSAISTNGKTLAYVAMREAD